MIQIGQHFLSKEFPLPSAVVSPNFQHDVCTPGGTIFLNPLDTFAWRAGNGTDFAQDFLSHSLSCGFAATLFHGISDGTQLIESQARAVEQYVSRPLYVLNFIREIHRRLLTSAFLSFRRIAANAADNH